MGPSVGNHTKQCILPGVFQSARTICASKEPTPILAEAPPAHNAPEYVIHSLGVLDSCVFHTIHNFSGFLVVMDERHRSSAGTLWETPPKAPHTRVFDTPDERSV
jgi:hypothetical protein